MNSERRQKQISRPPEYASCSKFSEVSRLLVKMDRLALRFRKTEPGTHFAAAWKATRMACDLGEAAPAEPATSTP